MEHLAQGRPQLPDAGARRPGPHAAHAGRPARRARHLPRGRVDAAAAAAPLRGGRPGAWRGCIWPAAELSSCERANALGVAGWRPLYRALPVARRRDRAGPRRHDRAGARPSGGPLAGRPAAGRHPRRPVSRQRVLPRRRAVRPDRLLFRLQRRAGLRHRRRAQRLVLRDRPRVQHHQGPGAAQGLSKRAHRSSRRSARPCRCWRAARRCASC